MSKKNIAFVFPGQGSQYVGMGKDFFDQFPLARDYFNQANRILGFDIAQLCFNGPGEDLTLTANTQPAILIVSIIAAKLLQEKGIAPKIVAGHSLGEYSALVTAGGLDFSEAVAVVHKRGKFMQEAVAPGKGGMAAILGLTEAEVEEICNTCQAQGQSVQPANFNSPEQTVIAGEKQAVESAMELAKNKGAKKVIPLNVSAPFHSSLMKPAEEKLARELRGLNFRPLLVPLVTNFEAKKISQGEEAEFSLEKQVSASVKWTKSMELIINEGIDTFVEVGPGRVLSGLMRRINKNITCLNVEDKKSLEETVEVLQA